MGKKLKDLKKGDHIWFVSPHYEAYEMFIGSEPPKVYEGVIDQSSTPQGSLPYPRYCLVYHYCPLLNPNHLNTSENGESEQGHNGHLFFTDYDDCVAYVRDYAQKKLEYAKKRVESMNKDIEELQDILNNGIKVLK